MAKGKKAEGVEEVSELPKLTPTERGVEYLTDHPKLGFNEVLVTSDNSVFFKSLQGENAAMNHSKTLENREVVKVNRDGESEVYKFSNTEKE
jgi:hypothetical protein